VSPTLHARIHTILKTAVTQSVPLSGGCVGDVRALDLADGRRVVVKAGGTQLDLEGWMLGYLSSHSRVPVPEVLHSEADLLVMSYLETAGGITATVEHDAADHIAALHDITGPAFGFERATLIGGLPQPNPPTESWIAFFAEQRLMHMAVEAEAEGRLPAATRARLENLCDHLDRWITEPEVPSLIHGDLWTGNVLCRDGRIAGFVDPALYYADPEIELAFATLFNTFGEAFFARYNEHRPIQPGFFEARRDLYNLYPLLVHVRLFGCSYLASIEETLKRFGV
jgi:fructosamine-3-kinase